MRMRWCSMIAFGGALGCGDLTGGAGGLPFSSSPEFPDTYGESTTGNDDLDTLPDPSTSTADPGTTTNPTTSTTGSTSTETTTTSETSSETTDVDESTSTTSTEDTSTEDTTSTTTTTSSSTSTTAAEDGSESTDDTGPPVEAGDIEYTVTIDSQWAQGECDSVALVNVSNGPVTWEIELEVVGTVNQAWNAVATQVGTTASFVGVPFNATLDPGESTSFGFCLTY